jgi:phage-related protein
MLDETFYIDGVDARNFGIYLQRPIEFSEAIPVVERQSIPGRNGDLIFETGSYENRTGTAHCFCLQKNVEKSIGAAGRFLMSKHGYRRLETSDDPDHFWLARIENSPAIAQRMRTLAPFEITFDCKPQRFLKSGEETVVLYPTEQDAGFGVTHTIYNQHGFPAHPLIKIFAIRDGAAFQLTCRQPNSSTEDRVMGSVRGGTLDISIDCDTYNAYNDSGNQNKNIESASGFPVIRPGENVLRVFGPSIEKVEFTPRWWEL